MRTCEHIVAIRMVKLCHKIVLKKLILHSHIIRCSCLSSSRTTNLEEAQMLQPTFSCPLIVFFYVTKSDLHAVSILSYRYYSLSDDGAKINIASRYICTIFYAQSTTKAWLHHNAPSIETTVVTNTFQSIHIFNIGLQ